MAIDISEKALEVAQINAAKNQTNIDFLQYDILSSADDFNAKQLDIMVSNPPYIPLSQKNVMSVSTIEHEPEIALFVPNEQPLLFYDKITDFAARHLKPNGKLYFELNEFNAEKVVEMLQQKHYINTTLHQDLSRKNRMLSAERPPSI